MKAKLAVMAMAALVLMVHQASAQHRAKGHVRHPARLSAPAYGFGARALPTQAPRERAPLDVYESYANGRQSVRNPDRDYSNIFEGP